MNKGYVDAIEEAKKEVIKCCFKHPRKRVFTTIKGFSNSLANLGYRYKKKHWLKKDGPFQLCKNGFHAINPAWCPLAVFDFYSPCESDFNVSRYFKVEMKEVEDCDNFKIVTRKIRLVEELDLEGILEMHAAWLGSKWILNRPLIQSNYQKVTLPSRTIHFGRKMLAATDAYSLIHSQLDSVIAATHHNSIDTGSNSVVSTLNSCLIKMDDECKLASGSTCWIEAGDRCHITTGNHSKVNAGYYSTVVAGRYSYVKLKAGFAMTQLHGISIVGNNSVAISNNGIVKVGAQSIGIVFRVNDLNECKPYFCGEIGSVFVYMPWLAFWSQNDYRIMHAAVDGVNILDNTWYTIENGEFVKAKESFLDSIN